jgi:hypothetical protein
MNKVLNQWLAGGKEDPLKQQLDKDTVLVAFAYLTQNDGAAAVAGVPAAECTSRMAYVQPMLSPSSACNVPGMRGECMWEKEACVQGLQNELVPAAFQGDGDDRVCAADRPVCCYQVRAFVGCIYDDCVPRCFVVSIDLLSIFLMLRTHLFT